MLVLYPNCDYIWIRGTTPLQGVYLDKINNLSPMLTNFREILYSNYMYSAFHWSVTRRTAADDGNHW